MIGIRLLIDVKIGPRLLRDVRLDYNRLGLNNSGQPSTTVYCIGVKQCLANYLAKTVPALNVSFGLLSKRASIGPNKLFWPIYTRSVTTTTVSALC